MFFYGSVYMASTAIQAISNLLILKYFSDHQGSDTVFVYTNCLYGSLIFGAVVFQGYFLVSKEPRREFNIEKPILITALLGSVFSFAALFLVLTIKSALYKFSAPHKTNPTRMLILCMAGVSAYFINGDNSLYLIVTLLSVMPFLLVGHAAISLPVPARFSVSLVWNAIQRSLIDIFLLVPPIVFNAITYKSLDANDYLTFQMCLASLGFGGIVTNIIERRSFDEAGKFIDQPIIFSRLFLGSIGLSVAVALVISSYYGVFYGYFYFITVFAILGTLFGFLLTRFRFLAGADTCLRMTALWALSFSILLALFEASTVVLTVSSALIIMIIFTVLKCVLLAQLTKKLVD